MIVGEATEAIKRPEISRFTPFCSFFSKWDSIRTCKNRVNWHVFGVFSLKTFDKKLFGTLHQLNEQLEKLFQ